jgi:putative spermidine/putrescine transport system ATP-binding protein
VKAARAGSGEDRPGTDSSSDQRERGLLVDGVTKELGHREVVSNLTLSVRPGELICLLGSSGCGKTTTLRMIGGFIEPDSGRVVIDGADVTRVAPEKRPTAMVFQSYALWPHMTVAKNVGYGLRLRRVPRPQIAARVAEMLELVGLAHHAGSYPATISGGEQQRVALARALIIEPAVLLLDEPLSNLDAQLRLRVREEIREIQQRLGITTVFVTHDQDEAMSIADRVAVMSEGRIEQLAEPELLYRYPQTRTVAEFIGTMSFFRATRRDQAVVLGDGTSVPVESRISWSAGSEADVAVRPEDVVIGPLTDRRDDSAAGRIARRIPRGHFTECVVQVGGQELRTFVPADRLLEHEVSVRLARVLVYQDGHLVAGADAPGPDHAAASLAGGRLSGSDAQPESLAANRDRP